MELFQARAPRIDLAACSRCGLCLIVCPADAIERVPATDGGWLPRIDDQRCIGCDDCEQICPNLAIETPFEIVYESSA